MKFIPDKKSFYFEILGRKMLVFKNLPMLAFDHLGNMLWGFF